MEKRLAMQRIADALAAVERIEDEACMRLDQLSEDAGCMGLFGEISDEDCE